MIVFVKLILAHLIGDFLLQPTSWVKDKEKKKHLSIYMYINTFLYFILAWILIGKIEFGWYALALALSHGFIDFLKLYFENDKSKVKLFLFSQLIFLLLIAITTITYMNLCFDDSFFNFKFWIIITSIILLSNPTSKIIFSILNIWFTNNENYKNNSLSKAGHYIGILERLLILLFILTNHFEAVGFLLATKSIFRFGEFKDEIYRELTEYYFIGTLLSFGIALLIGLLVRAGLGLSF